MPEDREQGLEPEETLDISLEDLDEEEQPAAPQVPAAARAGGQQGDTLVIDAEDLEVEPGPDYPAAVPGAYPEVAPGQAPYDLAAKKKGGVAGLVSSLFVQMMIAGALGGLLAWAINEPTMTLREQAGDIAERGIGWVMLFFAIIGGVVGLFLGALEGVSTGNWRKAFSQGGLSLLIGGAGGAIAGVLGQVVFAALGGTLGGFTPWQSATQIIARSAGWAIAGLFIGLSQGAPHMSVQKIVNGLCGGALGGFVGGVMFDTVGGFVGALTGLPGLFSRLIAIVAIGGATGAAIGLIEELRKEAWLIIISGPLSGKQFILYRQLTTIGSSPKSDIALVKDPAVAPEHCAVETAGAHANVRDLGTQTGTFVNGRPVQAQPLQRGDVIQIGDTQLQYLDRTLPR